MFGSLLEAYVQLIMSSATARNWMKEERDDNDLCSYMYSVVKVKLLLGVRSTSVLFTNIQ